MANRLCTVLGIKRPIISAPMGGAVGPDFTALISNLGGMGVIPLWRAAGPDIRNAVAEIKHQTDKPFAVNLNIEFLQDDQIPACLDAGVPAISLFWGMSPDAIKQVKDGGAKAIVTVGNSQEAKIAVDAGADVIVAQGWESGGHVWGKVATMGLVPAVVDVCGDVPVVAAGGIADSRGAAAAYALGAVGVWVGTRFLAAQEMQIHEIYRAALLAADDDASFHAHDLYNVGWENAPHRALKNKTYESWVDAGRPSPGSRSGEGETIGMSGAGQPISAYRSWTPGPKDTGDIGEMSMWAGQGTAQLRDVMPASDIMDELDQGAFKHLSSLQGVIKS